MPRRSGDSASAGLVALERTIAEACMSDQVLPPTETELRAFLAARGVDPDDAAAILAAPPRLGVYRSLVRNGLATVVARMLPETRARLNAACDGRFDRDFRAFLAAAGPQTHYLRDVPSEFHDWASPRWRADAGVPAYVVDLAAHELASFAVAAREVGGDEQALDVALDRPVAFAGTVELARYTFAVHELPAFDSSDAATHQPPARRPVTLLAYRDAEHAVRWLELTPLAAAITERLLDGATLGEAVASACAGYGTNPTAAAPDIARLLAELGERGVLLGARDASLEP